MNPKQVIIRELVEEAMSTGRTVEDVCTGHPDLLHDVRTLWIQACSVSDQIESIFPSPDAHAARLTGSSFGDDAHISLPQIPGYEVQGVLGAGGMGVVYKARHISLNRTVAIKVPLTGAFATTAERQRHHREARAIAALDHRNIVTVHDVGEFDGRPYLTMEFIDGQTLGDRLARTPQPARDAAALVATLADAIHYGHMAGVIHRDLKPANVLLTPDGVPKITDFGLARRVNHDATLTAAGVHFGTPSYMSPELAGGRSDARSTSVDIYALGAILYEMLTGRPPFQSEHAIETIRQVLEEEPTPPTRLNRTVPRDLETICLTCLRKVPGQRYATAAELAHDLRRFLSGEPIHARPTALPERTIKWVRRKPAIAIASLSVLLLLAIVATVVIWQSSERAARAAAAEQDLLEAVRLQRAASWKEAEAAIERAALRLGGGGSSRIKDHLAAVKHDSALAARLEKIRLDRVSSVNGYYLDEVVSASYAELFRDEGIITSDDENPELAAARVRASPIRHALLDGIDMWIVIAKERRPLLETIAQHIDPSPQRKHLFELAAKPDQASIDRLVETLQIADHSPMMLTTFAERVEYDNVDVVPLLTAVQRAHPTDFWANMVLADALTSVAADEAIRYYQAALVLRPDASVVYNNFGNALAKAERYEEAAASYETALKLDPAGGIIRVNYAWTMSDLGRDKEAVDIARAALTMENPAPEVWLILCAALFKLDQPEEATAALRKASEYPTVEGPRRDVFRALCRWGLLDAARTVWAEHVRLNPSHHANWDGYAELCLYLGDTAAYVTACEQLLAKFGDDPDPGIAERSGRACLLSPDSSAQHARAIAAIDRAIASEENLPKPTWRLSYYRVAGALGAYRTADYHRALTLLDGSTYEILGPMSLLLTAMSEHQLGKTDEARETFADALRRYNWNDPPDHREVWMFHIIRREAESLINPPASHPEPSTTHR